MISLLGCALLVVLALAFELRQRGCERRQDDALFSLKRRAESLADSLKRNGGLKAARKGDQNALDR